MIEEKPAATIPSTNKVEVQAPRGDKVCTISMALSTFIPCICKVAAAQTIMEKLNRKVRNMALAESTRSVGKSWSVHCFSLTRMLLDTSTTEAIVVPTMPEIIR
jgi:hypothetical protein